MILRIVVSLIAVVALASCGPSAPVAEVPATVAETVSAGAATAQPTLTPTRRPTTTPRPTSTPRPTHTPAPTATTRPLNTRTPTPIPVQPVVVSGVGREVTAPVSLPAGIYKITLAHAGQRNFIVKRYDADGSEEYVTNAIGDYQGSRPFLGGENFYLEIEADGPWTISIIPLEADPSAAGEIRGEGDFVSGLFRPPRVGPVPYQFMHTGERNFIVQLVCRGGADYVQNEIGQVDGPAVVNFKDGPCLWDIQADGAWTIAPR